MRGYYVNAVPQWRTVAMKRIFLGMAAVAALTATPGAADRPWTLIRGANVVVVGQQSARTLRGVAIEIEEFRVAFGELVAGAKQPLSIPTFVYLFDDRKAMSPFVPLHDGKPAPLGGYCYCASDSDVSFIALTLGGFEESSAIIFHEYTHLLVHRASRGVPVWLNEGLAEYYSTFRLTGDRLKAEVGRPIDHHVSLLRRESIPLADLLAVGHSSSLYNEAARRSVFYAESWALTHYLLAGRPDGAAAVNRYMTALADGREQGDAFREAFGVTPVEMDKELRQYVRRPSFLSMTYALPARVDVDEPERARTLAAADAEARLGEVQMRIGRMDEATVRIEAAAARGPEVAQAQLTLALLRMRQGGESAPTVTLLQKAAALAPDDFLTLYTYALALLRQDPDWPPSTQSPQKTQNNENSPPDDPREMAHAVLTRAVALNPDSADALAWQAYADVALGVRLPEARAAITRAIALVPGRLDYRLRLAEVCLRQGDHAEARRLLKEIAVAMGDEATSYEARLLLAQLDRR